MTSLTAAPADMTQMIDDGVASIDARIAAQFASDKPDQDLIRQLHDLRSRYIFNRMEALHAQMSVDDGSPALAAAVGALTAAIDDLKKIHADSIATNKWITKASSALDKAFTVYSKVSSFVEQGKTDT